MARAKAQIPPPTTTPDKDDIPDFGTDGQQLAAPPEAAAATMALAAAAAGYETDPVFAGLMRASTITNLDRIKLLLYGPNGGGKSRLAASFKRPLIGLTEMQAVPTIKLANPNAVIFPIRDIVGLRKFAEMLTHPKLGEWFDAVALDSLTDAQRIFRFYFTKEQKNKAGQTLTTDEGTWGVIIDATAKLARMIRDVPCHAVTICLEKELMVGSELVHRPSVAGKQLPNDLGQYANLVGYLHKRELPTGGFRHEVMFRGNDRYTTKGMEGLDDVEPPEPEYWIGKRFGEIPSTEVLARVEQWEALVASDEEKADALVVSGNVKPAPVADGAGSTSNETADPFAV